VLSLLLEATDQSSCGNVRRNFSRRVQRYGCATSGRLDIAFGTRHASSEILQRYRAYLNAKDAPYSRALVAEYQVIANCRERSESPEAKSRRPGGAGKRHWALLLDGRHEPGPRSTGSHLEIVFLPLANGVAGADNLRRLLLTGHGKGR
jgi:hypothetical protein